MYNITADHGVLGVEVRPIPQDDLVALKDELQGYCDSQGLQLQISVMENGVVCDPKNAYLKSLLEAVQKAGGQEIPLGKKLPGTSARFAPAGQGVVWGQTGLGPHSRAERHFIPSILPYYRALQEYGKILMKG
jgi:acetylornithine deacetylase/succinyl-diaminopimelate desuccinylase-like protein